MPGFLDLLKQYGPAVLDTAGSLYGNSRNTSAANSAANRTQFMPYNLNVAGNVGNFNGTTGTANFSGPNQQVYSTIQQLLAGKLGQAGQGAPSYLTNAFDTSQAQSPGANPALLSSGQGYLDAGTNLLGQAQGQLQSVPGWEGAYNSQLDLMRRGAAPQEAQLRSGNYDNQFAKGILSSSAGGYQTEGLERALAGADLQRQQQAFGQAQQFQQGQQQLGLNSLNASLGSSGLGAGFLGQYFGQASSSMNDRLTRALNMFGAQTQGDQANQNLVSGYLGNMQGMENGLQNLLGLGGNLGSAQSGANSFGAGLQYKSDTTNADNIAGLLGDMNWSDIIGRFSGNPSVAGGTGALTGTAANAGSLAGLGGSLATPAALAPSAFAPTAASQAAVSAAAGGGGGGAVGGLGAAGSGALAGLAFMGALISGAGRGQTGVIPGGIHSLDVNGNPTFSENMGQYLDRLREFQLAPGAAEKYANPQIDTNSPEYQALLASVLGPNFGG